jgi:hypothetical protein
VFEGGVHDGGPRPAFAPRVWLSAMQRKEPVAVGGRTHGKRYQADVRFGCRRSPERQLCEGELTPDGD